MKTGKFRSDDEIRFLNVDLDIVASHDLAPLVEAMGEAVKDMYTGPAGETYESHLELAGYPDSPERAILGFVNILERLPPKAKSLWKNATRRDFNVGIQSGLTPRAFEFALQPDTLKAAAKLSAGVAVTIYAVDLKDLERQRRRAARRS